MSVSYSVQYRPVFMRPCMSNGKSLSWGGGLSPSPNVWPQQTWSVGVIVTHSVDEHLRWLWISTGWPKKV